MNKKLTVEKHI